MFIRDCIRIHTPEDMDRAPELGALYAPEEEELFLSQLLIPPKKAARFTECVREGLDAARAGRCLLLHGDRHCGKTTLLLTMAELLDTGNGAAVDRILGLFGEAELSEDEEEPAAAPPETDRRLVLALGLKGAVPTGTGPESVNALARQAASEGLRRLGLTDETSGGTLKDRIRNADAMAEAAGSPGTVLLLDDLDRFLQENPGGSPSLEQVCQGILSRGGRVGCVFGTAATPSALRRLIPDSMPGLRKLVENAEVSEADSCGVFLIGRLVGVADEDNYFQMVTRFIRQKDHYFNTHFLQLRRWGRENDPGRLWEDYDQYLRWAVSEIYPLHPFTLYALSHLAPCLKKHSAVYYAEKLLQTSMDREFVRVWPPFVYPAELLTDEFCEELLEAERDGRLAGNVITSFCRVREVLGDRLQPAEEAALKGIALGLLCRLI